MIDKEFCMSSYLTFRYIEKDNMDFFAGLQHKNITAVKEEEKILVSNACEVDYYLKEIFEKLKEKKLGILLSGGMDSACLLEYMKGMDAYTFRFLDGEYQKEELKRAEYFSEYYNMKLHYVDITWDNILPYIDPIMLAKNAPVHSIEPQLLFAAEQAKKDGIEHLIVGESADLVFGGMDQLLSKDWNYEEFKKRYTFLEPNLVLTNPVDMSYLFERYRVGQKIDFMKFMEEVYTIESSSSYWNAFNVAQIAYTDPYKYFKLSEPLDLARVRNGESKYVIRDLFKMKYPDYTIPEKNPMPRPVDYYFANWKGPKRKEFKDDLDMRNFTGNQKWQMWCLEHFLDINDPNETKRN